MSARSSGKPPALANWLASKFLDNRYTEEFFGDLREMYEQRLSERGRSYAWLMYWFDTFHLLVGFSSLRAFKPHYTNMMFRSMLKMTWRNAARQKQFTFLNLAGLTMGIATCCIIGLFVYDEMTYDTFHAKGDRIYRVNQPMIWSNWDEQFASTGPNVAIALSEDAPEFEHVTRIMELGEQTLNAPASGKELNAITEARFFAADSNFFEVFSFAFLHGDTKTSLKEPMSMVVTAETAIRYFGNADVLGRTLDVKLKDGAWDTYVITGVLQNIPVKSHLRFDMLIPISSLGGMMRQHEWKWIYTAFSTYGLVREGTDIEALIDKIQAIPPKWAALTTERIFNQTFSEYTRGRSWKLYLQPLRNIYLSSMPGHHRFGPTGNPLFVKVFGAVGVLVLALSIVNFMNLSTARASNRAKEVGIRKVMGSQRALLMRQFIFESVLFVAVGTMAAMVIVQLSLNGFNSIAGKALALTPYLSAPFFIGIVVLFILLLGVLAGSYPAFYLSSFQPIETLKGKASAGFTGKGIRNGLVIFQFTISVTLVICAAFVQRQLAYTSSMDIGIARDNILQIHKIEQLGTNADVLKHKLEASPSISRVARSFAIPTRVWEGEQYKAFGRENPPVVDISNLRADDDYLDLLGVEFLAGRNFDEERVTDRYAVILNEEAVKILGWGTREGYATDSPVGKFVVQAFDEERKLEVLGVVRNFNFNSVRERIEPLMIIHAKNDWFWNVGKGPSFLSLRLNPATVRDAGDLQRVIDEVKAEMTQMDDTVPFEYSFMDENFEHTFRSESSMGGVLNIFTFMAMVIACLGLFGLAAFSAEQRKRELGIRKIMGAGVSELMVLFTSEFTKLILISILLAVPAAYFLADAWLSNFAHRTPIESWVFVASAGGALVIAVATIGYQSFSAANVNPVDTLRNEK